MSPSELSAVKYNKAKASANPALPLFWVNKDANSETFSVSSAKERLAVFSHAQRCSRAIRRRQKQARVKEELRSSTGSATSSLVGWRRLSEVSTSSSQTDDSFSTQGSFDWRSSNSCDGSGHTEPSADNEYPPAEDKLMIRSICGKGEALDPFHAAPTHIDGQTHTVLQYYSKCHLYPTASSIWSLIKEDPSGSRVPMSKVIEECMSNELCMNGVLAVTACRMQFVDRFDINFAALYTQKALASMRQTLNVTNADCLQLFSILQLYIAEGFAANTNNALVHLRAAKTVADSLGGLDAMQEYLMDHIDGATEVIMAESLTDNRDFPCLHDPGNANEAHLQDRQIFTVDKICDHLGEALISPVPNFKNQGLVDHDMLEVIKDMIEWAEIKQYSFEDPAATTTQLRKWLKFRNLALRCRLMSNTHPAVRVQALSFALVMWLVNATAVPGCKRTLQIGSSHLKHILEQTGDSWNRHPEILIWILTIGAMFAEGTEEQQWFLAQLLTYCYCHLDWTLDVETKLRTLSERFFYLDAIQGSALTKMALQLERTRNTSRTRRILPRRQLEAGQMYNKWMPRFVGTDWDVTMSFSPRLKNIGR